MERNNEYCIGSEKVSTRSTVAQRQKFQVLMRLEPYSILNLLLNLSGFEPEYSCKFYSYEKVYTRVIFHMKEEWFSSYMFSVHLFLQNIKLCTGASPGLNFEGRVWFILFCYSFEDFLNTVVCVRSYCCLGHGPQLPGSAPGYAGNTEEVLGLHEMDGVEVLLFDEWLQNGDPLGTGNSYREGR